MRFIKITQLQVLLTVFIFTVTCKNTEKPKVADKKIDVLAYVDPMIGTGFLGHTFPGAVMPHGRVQLSPDTHTYWGGKQVVATTIRILLYMDLATPT